MEQQPPSITKEALSLIEKATQCNYFPAMSFLNKTLSEIAIRQGNFHHEANITNALKLLNRCAVLYGSPGYIELARYHLQLAAYYQENKKQDCAQPEWLKALVALNVAKQIAPYCTIAIYNAYGEVAMPDDDILSMLSLLTQQCQQQELAINMATQEIANWQASNPDMLEAITPTCRV